MYRLESGEDARHMRLVAWKAAPDVQYVRLVARSGQHVERSSRHWNSASHRVRVLERRAAMERHANQLYKWQDDLLMCFLVSVCLNNPYLLVSICT